MRNRDDMSAVIEGLQRDHALLAAFLEATDKIDWQALHRRVAISQAPEPSPFVFRRANLVRIAESSDWRRSISP
jgi:hypothetical protein